LVYEIHLTNGASHLINAMSGELFSITPELAQRFVLNTYSKEGRVRKVETVERHGYAYQWGALPAYRVVLDRDSSVDFFVTVNDGAVRRSDRWNRMRGAVGSLHTFEPLKLFTRRDGVRKALLVLTGIIGIAAAITGYSLALRRA
jgi:hypothetical protein